MKKFLLGLFIFAVSFSLLPAGVSFARNVNYEHVDEVESVHGGHESAAKFVRGCKNVVFCPLEIPYQIYATGKREGAGTAVSVGLVKGIMMVPVRFVSGLLDVFTCFGHTDWEDEMNLNR